MGKSNIEWCDYTWNPWRGCSKVNTGCMNCYAVKSRPVLIHGTKWGTEAQGGTRTVAAEGTWRGPSQWNKKTLRCSRCGKWWSNRTDVTHCDCGFEIDSMFEGRPRVFLGSLMDWAEDWTIGLLNHEKLSGWKDGIGWWYGKRPSSFASPLTMNDVRHRMFETIDACQNLDFLMLTKRPENIRKFYGNAHRKNVWLGTSVADQATAEQAIPELLKCRDLAAKLFLSVEPLVGPVDLGLDCDEVWICPECRSENVDPDLHSDDGKHWHCSSCGANEMGEPDVKPGIDWVIVGGESGPKARPCNIEWIRDIARQCQAAGVPCFIKQLGANCFERSSATTYSILSNSLCTHVEFPFELLDDEGFFIQHPKRGDISEWPEGLRIRQFPGESS